jgi:hypothetical protein
VCPKVNKSSGEGAFGFVLGKSLLWAKALPPVEVRPILEDYKPYHKSYASQFELELRG